MLRVRWCGGGVRALLAVFVGLAIACGIGVRLAYPQTDEATALSTQADKLYQQGRYSEAVPLAQRSLAIREKALGPDHPSVAQSLNKLAGAVGAFGRD